MREAEINRKTNETSVSVNLNLDGTGKTSNNTGIGFFDHMLDQLAKHSLFDIETNADGDLHIDDHHTVEDVGICIGKAIKKAVGEKVGIRRYGSCILPMDEALVRSALDLSGRATLVWNVKFLSKKIGFFDVELINEFFKALSINAEITLHVDLLTGSNSHHIAEATFKSVAQSLKKAVEIDDRRAKLIPSTKGTLSE